MSGAGVAEGLVSRKLASARPCGAAQTASSRPAASRAPRSPKTSRVEAFEADTPSRLPRARPLPPPIGPFGPPGPPERTRRSAGRGRPETVSGEDERAAAQHLVQGPGRGRCELAVPGLPAGVRAGALPGGDLHLGQRRDRARHPRRLPPPRRGPGQHRLRGEARRLGRGRGGQLHRRPAAPGGPAADRDRRGGPRGRHRRRTARQPDRGHRVRRRHRVPLRRLRRPGRVRRPRHRPQHARGPRRAQRGPAGVRYEAAPRHGARDRADAGRGRYGRPPVRGGRPDPAERRRQPRRASGAPVAITADGPRILTAL
ncbi:hypothetical protein EDD91_1840 [Streptomyces sp. KS 21]|nr:hypothetical protein EDD91_1840 [Streptomyces sp. KS 21]